MNSKSDRRFWESKNEATPIHYGAMQCKGRAEGRLRKIDSFSILSPLSFAIASRSRRRKTMTTTVKYVLQPTTRRTGRSGGEKLSGGHYPNAAKRWREEAWGMDGRIEHWDGVETGNVKMWLQYREQILPNEGRVVSNPTRHTHWTPSKLLADSQASSRLYGFDSGFWGMDDATDRGSIIPSRPIL